jgi:hypothetical protein
MIAMTAGHAEKMPAPKMLLPPTPARFEELQELPWKEQFFDAGISGWKDGWFLDGLIATVENTPDGIEIKGGENMDDEAYFCVLWTKQSFEGDVRIEFDYTRLDSSLEGVNILYVQATGIDEGPYGKDITKWSKLREVPNMYKYFRYMNTLHISFAAHYGGVSKDLDEDYVRARYYPIPEGQRNDLMPDSFHTKLFHPGVTYHVTVIKTGTELFIHFKNEDTDRMFSWYTSAYPEIKGGRIGIRHMATRESRYANFSVSTLGCCEKSANK